MKHTLYLTAEETNRLCKPVPHPKCRFRGIRGAMGEIIVDIRDGRVVTPESDYITTRQLQYIRQLLESAAEVRQEVKNGRSDETWAKTAIEREIAAIAAMNGDNPHRPDSQFWASLIRIASVLKGSGWKRIDPGWARNQILATAPADLLTKGDRAKDIAYLFGRAMNRATPRYRNDQP